MLLGGRRSAYTSVPGLDSVAKRIAENQRDSFSPRYNLTLIARACPEGLKANCPPVVSSQSVMGEMPFTILASMNRAIVTNAIVPGKHHDSSTHLTHRDVCQAFVCIYRYLSVPSSIRCCLEGCMQVDTYIQRHIDRSQPLLNDKERWRCTI